MEDSEKPSAHIRPVSRETGHTKLRSLECFDEVHQHVLEGWTPSNLAKFIQEDKGEYLDAARTTVISALKDYRASIPPAELISQRMPEEFNKAVKKLKKGIDEVAELEWLTSFQKRRLKIDGETERKINKLLPTMTQEVRAHVEVLRTLASVKMDLGVNKRHLGSLEVDATLVSEVTSRYGTASVAKVLKSAQSRQKVMGVAERFLALAQREISGEPDVPRGEEEDAQVVDVVAEPAAPEPTIPPKPESGNDSK